MSFALVTGSAGLIGAETVRLFHAQGFQILGLDNDMRREFFGDDASTEWSRRELEEELPGYLHHDLDIRDRKGVEALFAKYSSDIKAVIHTAAQPSHDWAAGNPHTDFSVNANGTLNLLEATRQHCPQAAFIFTSTNKVYGDNPNQLPLVEEETRWEIAGEHPYHQHGIDEQMSVDHTQHSLFGVSKLAADSLVQEYGRCFKMKTVCFRGGCLTGPGHSGAMLHGFLSYLMKCAITGEQYTVFGHKGKQVRDNIHARDLVSMFWHYFLNPRGGEVYNAGGSRHSNCSMQEAMDVCRELTGRQMNVRYSDRARSGDHVWYISDVRKFRLHYPEWSYAYDLRRTMGEIYESMSARVSGMRFSRSSLARMRGGNTCPVPTDCAEPCPK